MTTPLEAYQKRKAAAETSREPRFAPKDWIAIAFSVLAAVISILTAYFNVLLKTDELRIAVVGHPGLTLDRGTGIVKMTGQLSVIFINSGNQPVAILASNIVVVNHFDKDHDVKECFGRGFETSMEPFVLKENEIVQKQMNLTLGKRQMKDMTISESGELSFSAFPEFETSKRLSVSLCAEFVGTSAMQERVRGAVQLVDVSYGDRSFGVTTEFRDRPVTIWQLSRTVFTR